MTRLVVIESPYAAPAHLRGDRLAAGVRVELNMDYARAALRDALDRGEAPFASHLLYTQGAQGRALLDDTDREQRAKGIAAGLAWSRAADASIFYLDLGCSPGMIAAERMTVGRLGVEARWLGDTWSKHTPEGCTCRRVWPCAACLDRARGAA